MEIRDRVLKVLSSELGVGVAEINDDSHIQNDLGADSLDVVEVAMALEDEFGITVPDEKVQELKTVKDVIDCVSNPT